jgi:hypothetical protein
MIRTDHKSALLVIINRTILVTLIENSKKYASLNTREDRAKTIVAQAKLEVPGFEAYYAKFEEQTLIGGAKAEVQHQQYFDVAQHKYFDVAQSKSLRRSSVRVTSTQLGTINELRPLPQLFTT